MEQTGQPALCGLLNLNKPTGVTSRDVVDLVALPLRPLRVGHAGTLDPLASGVLVVCVGVATRLIEYVQRMRKTYRTVAFLGAESDTLDADGRVVPVAEPRVPTEEEIRRVLRDQIGAITQKPPQFSALKVAGRRAYDLARAGREVDLAPRTVTVYRIDMRSYEWPRLELEIECGSGTYIRSIVRDIGQSLGCGALVEALVRTAVGPFTLADALIPQDLSAASISVQLRPALEAVAGLPQLSLVDHEVRAIVQGQSAELRSARQNERFSGGEVALIGPDGSLIAIAEAERDSGRVTPLKVLVSHTTIAGKSAN
jgi:tRNA pseudouridine55 synthase